MPENLKTSCDSRRGFVQGGIGLAAASTLGSLSVSIFSRDARAATELNFVTPFGYLIGFAPVLYAVSGGFFEKEGLTVNVQGGKGSAMAVQQVLSGQATFSRTGGVDLIRAAGTQGAPLKAIATVVQASPMFVISHRDQPINSPDDMKGKTIGITSKGGLAENLLNMMLENNGIGAGTIERQAVGNAPGAFGLIEKGSVNAYIASMGTVVKLKEAGQPINAWNTDKFAPVPGQVYVASLDTINNSPQTVMSFLKAVDKSMNALFAAKDMSPILDSLKQKFKIRGIEDQKTAESALRAEMELFAAEGKQNLLRNVPARWQRAHDLMSKVGLVKAGDASSLYTNEFIDKIKS